MASVDVLDISPLATFTNWRSWPEEPIDTVASAVTPSTVVGDFAVLLLPMTTALFIPVGILMLLPIAKALLDWIELLLPIVTELTPVIVLSRPIPMASSPVIKPFVPIPIAFLPVTRLLLPTAIALVPIFFKSLSASVRFASSSAAWSASSFAFTRAAAAASSNSCCVGCNWAFSRCLALTAASAACTLAFKSSSLACLSAIAALYWSDNVLTVNVLDCITSVTLVLSQEEKELIQESGDAFNVFNLLNKVFASSSSLILFCKWTNACVGLELFRESYKYCSCFISNKTWLLSFCNEIAVIILSLDACVNAPEIGIDSISDLARSKLSIEFKYVLYCVSLKEATLDNSEVALK